MAHHYTDRRITDADAQHILDAIPGSYRVYHNDGSTSIVYAVINIDPRTDYHAFTRAVFDAERALANALAPANAG